MTDHKRNPETTRPRCATCVHWIQRQGDVGECTAEPPTVIVLLSPSRMMPGQAQKEVIGQFPPTNAHTSCGAHPHFRGWLHDSGIGTIRALTPTEGSA